MDFSRASKSNYNEGFKYAETGSEARSGVNWPDGSGVQLNKKLELLKKHKTLAAGEKLKKISSEKIGL